MSNPQNAALLDDQGTATITDNDRGTGDSELPPGVPTLSINNVTVNEDAGSAVFTLALSNASDTQVAVLQRPRVRQAESDYPPQRLVAFQPADGKRVVAVHTMTREATDVRVG